MKRLRGPEIRAALDDLYRLYPPKVEYVEHHQRPVSRPCTEGRHGACDGLVPPPEGTRLVPSSLCWCSCLHRDPIPPSSEPTGLAPDTRYIATDALRACLGESA